MRDRWGWSGWSTALPSSPSSAISWRAAWRQSSRRCFLSAGQSAVCEIRHKTPPPAERWENWSSDRKMRHSYWSVIWRHVACTDITCKNIHQCYLWRLKVAFPNINLDQCYRSENSKRMLPNQMLCGQANINATNNSSLNTHMNVLCPNIMQVFFQKSKYQTNLNVDLMVALQEMSENH